MYAPDPRDEALNSLRYENEQYSYERDQEMIRDVQAEIQLDDDME